MSPSKIINSKLLFYHKYDPAVQWAADVADKNWVLAVHANMVPKQVLKQIACTAIDNSPYYVCCAGAQSELLHDLIDDEIVLRQVGVTIGHLPRHDIVTTWHEAVDDALWYACYAALVDDGDVEAVLYLDASEGEHEPDWDKIIAGWELDQTNGS